MSDEHAKPEGLSARAYAGSPLGVGAMVAGLVFTIVFLFRFHSILGDVSNGDLRAAIEALEITVVAVWIGVFLWGWYLVRDGLERANTNRRLNQQATTLHRIEKALADQDKVKETLTEKSRSFWIWRRGDDT